jgi:hypothetical protein
MHVLIDSCGFVLSRHRSALAAQESDVRLQRAVRRANGPNAYLMTAVYEVTGKIKSGRLERNEGRFVCSL